MKHLFLSFGLAALAGAAFASPVNVQTAQTVASNFIGRKMGSNVVLSLTKSIPANSVTGQTSIYIFDVNNGNGFVIVSGDDAVTPVLAYSAEHLFPAQITNKNVAYWLDNYNQQISTVIDRHLTANAQVASDWAALVAPASGHTASKVTDVAPLISSLWDQWNPQGGNNTLYNNLCPAETPTGCVATAMAQIMRFWMSPTVGSGTHSYTTSTVGGSLTANFGATTYDWANMPLTMSNSSSSTQKNAVAKLMFHCGVSVNMDYNLASVGGSGAQVINYYGQFGATYACSQYALPTYFGYKSTIKGVVRQFYTDTAWISLLKFELDHGRPVLYTGYGAGEGHAFDFDGYDNTGKFDINWGWSGFGNGYYTVDNLTPTSPGVGAGSGTFNDGQQALIMIEPANSSLPANPVYPDFPGYTLALNAAINQSNDTILYNTAYTATAQIKNIGTDTLQGGTLYLIATNNSTANSFILSQKIAAINPSASYTFTFNTTGSTALVPGTYTLQYKYMVYSNWDTTKLLVQNGVSTNSATLYVKQAVTGVSNVALNGATLNIYPNPAHSEVTLDWKGYAGKIKAVELYNVLGQQVDNFTDITGSNTTIPVSQLAAGTYIANIVTDLGTISKEITVK